jgi:hypothetical protein
VERLPGGFAATLESLRLTQDALAATLTAPSTVTVQNGTVTLTPLALDLGEGSLTAEGSVAEEIDISLDITEVPLALANTLLPDLGLDGVVNGTARVTGPRSAPAVSFEITATEVATPQTLATGLPPLAVTASGQTIGGRLALIAYQPGHGTGIVMAQSVFQAKRFGVDCSEFRMIAAPALGDVMKQASEVNDLRFLERLHDTAAMWILIIEPGKCEASQIADHEKRVLVDRVSMKQVVLHTSDNAAE